MLFTLFQERVVFLVAALVFPNPTFGELARLNIFQRGLHPLLHAGVDDFGTDADVAPLGSFGDGETHAADPGFVPEVDDELTLMATFEESNFRVVTAFVTTS